MQASGARLTTQCHSVDIMNRNDYRPYASGTPSPKNPRARTFPPPGLMFAPIQGRSGWVNSEHFTITAKADQPAGEEMMPAR